MKKNVELPLLGKAVLITGGAKRLGRASAMALARAGADVAITFNRSAREAQHTVIDLASLGVRAFALQCDVTSEKSVKAAVKEAVKELGGIDILVNNAANYETVEFDKITLAQWDAIFASNTRGPFLVTREGDQHGVAGRDGAVAFARALLFFKSGAPYVDEGHGQSAGS
jgi:3-oxoacyl-[acyl-carrier protein] reductase/pteridine reductase